MTTIGTFKKSGSDYAGNIVTLSVQAEKVRIIAQTKDSDPSHRVFVGNVEIGAAWTKRSREGQPYLALMLDDPSFTAPIYANLYDVYGTETFSLIWSRPNVRLGD
jgi:uncharacterized protein (DUF736 family)